MTKMKKLYLIHTGYYDKNTGDGFYEQHTNILVVAKNAYSAKEKVKLNKDYMEKKMHIDGIKEIENIDGYEVQLKKTTNNEKITLSEEKYSELYDEMFKSSII